MFSELFIELAKCTLPKPFVQYVSRLSSDFENIYDAISEFDSHELLTIYNSTGHTPVKQLRSHFNLAASFLLESSADVVFQLKNLIFKIGGYMLLFSFFIL